MLHLTFGLFTAHQDGPTLAGSSTSHSKTSPKLGTSRFSTGPTTGQASGCWQPRPHTTGGRLRCDWFPGQNTPSEWQLSVIWGGALTALHLKKSVPHQCQGHLEIHAEYEKLQIKLVFSFLNGL